MKKRLSLEKMSLDEWFRILKESKEDNREIRVSLVDDEDENNSMEYVLHDEIDILEFGFQTETQAWERLNEVRKNLIELISK